MKILVPLTYLSVFGKNTNPFVMSLANGLKKCGHTVVCSIDDLWQDYRQYDVVFFQWPDFLHSFVNNFGMKQLEHHLDSVKNCGVKMVVTCHNLHPHDNNSLTEDIYSLIYSKVDAIHHLGDYSFQLMKQKYPNKYHFIVPHHIADSFFYNKYSRETAREILHISQDNIVISSFGAFRNIGEERLFLRMVKDVSNNNIFFLAPRLSKGGLYNGRMISKSIFNLHKRLLIKKYNIRCNSSFLSDDEQKIWLAASDIIFIQRKKILNSGNIPLAFSLGKVVVGPDTGNVGCILKQTDNYLFDPNNNLSVKKAVEDAIMDVNNSDKGSKNFLYAKENWTTENICKLITKHLMNISDDKS